MLIKDMPALKIAHFSTIAAIFAYKYFVANTHFKPKTFTFAAIIEIKI